MSNFWKIECNICGVNCDLLKDKYHRIFCRECLRKYEFNEVENEIHSEDSKEEKDILRDDLLCSSIKNEDHLDSWNEITSALHGVE